MLKKESLRNWKRKKAERSYKLPEINVHDEKADKDILMRYETHGNPKDPAIVFVHGWLCNRRFWDDFLVLKDEGYFLIVPDVRGHGDTD